MYSCVDVFFFFKQKTAYEMRISDWSSDVCSSDLQATLIKVHFEGDSRNVSLNEGQARFQVAHDSDRPFIVDAGRRSVRALGTDFNVDRNHGNITEIGRAHV